MSRRADRILARGQAAALRELAWQLGEAMRSTDPKVRADAYEFASTLWPEPTSLADTARITRGMPIPERSGP